MTLWWMWMAISACNSALAPYNFSRKKVSFILREYRAYLITYECVEEAMNPRARPVPQVL